MNLQFHLFFYSIKYIS